MTLGKGTYVLSQPAAEDLGEIFDYTALEFGHHQAVRYLDGMEQVFCQLAADPVLGRERTEIRIGLRSIAYRSHVIFYRILGRRIRVVRVLHGSRDLQQILK
jgi:toxin ParE1/3/4